MRFHIYSETRKTVRIAAIDLLKSLGIDPLVYEIRGARATAGGFERNEVSSELELDLVERRPNEARK